MTACPMHSARVKLSLVCAVYEAQPNAWYAGRRHVKKARKAMLSLIFPRYRLMCDTIGKQHWLITTAAYHRHAYRVISHRV